ncbi:MAG: DUF4124 domain-containing protein [Pseudomonadota bacterium]|nr:DUF4124 domain-containing protein [Pseudomonadota bacterium]
MFLTSRLTAVLLLPLLLPLLLLRAGHAQAQTTVYKCVDQAGLILFTDRAGKGCTVLNVDTTIAAPASAQSSRRAAGPARPGAAPAASSPVDFPKVNGAQQRARDDDRREILNDELRSEEKKLAELRREFNGGEPERIGGERNFAKYQERVAQMKDNIGRAEKNVDALKREIANIR